MKRTPFLLGILGVGLITVGLLHAQPTVETNSADDLPSAEDGSTSTAIEQPGSDFEGVPSIPSTFFEDEEPPPVPSTTPSVPVEPPGDQIIREPSSQPSSQPSATLRPPADFASEPDFSSEPDPDTSSSVLDAERELIERRRLKNELRNEITKELSTREQLKEEILRELRGEMDGETIPTSSSRSSYSSSSKNIQGSGSLITDTMSRPSRSSRSSRSGMSLRRQDTTPRRDPFRTRVPPQGITLDYVPVGNISYLEPAVLKVEPKATIVPQGQYERQVDGSYSVTPRPGQFLPERVYLRSNAYWAEPVTAPEARITETDACVFRFAEIDGEVLVKSKFNRNEFVHATETLEVPYNAVVMTGDMSSTAMILHDRQSLRIGPNAMLRVTQVRKGRILKTRVELVRGIVFCKVGRRKKGGPIDFGVKASQTRTYVKGTDFAVWSRNGQDVVAVATGKVEVQDSDGNMLTMLQNGAQGNLRMFSYPALGEAKEGEWLMLTLRLARAMNVKTAYLLDLVKRRVPLRPEQESWLARVHRIYWVKPVEVPSLFPTEPERFEPMADDGSLPSPDDYFPNGQFK